MIKKCFTLTVAAVMILQLLSPFTFAQETGSVAPVPDLEVCTLPRADYKDFNNFRLAYQASVVDQQPVLAQDHFQSMETILAAHCDTLASIVQVQAEDLDGQCNDIVNHLLAKNNYYITMGRSDDAIATQGLIQTVFQEQDCAPIIQPASELSIDLIEQDIATNQTIDPSMQVIPFESNVCFMQYGPAHEFTQQIQRVSNQSVLDSIYNSVATYMTNLDTVVMDAVMQKEREGTLLKFARNVVQNQRLQWLFGNIPELQTTFHTQLTQVVQVISSVISAESANAAATLIQSNTSQIEEYVGMIAQLPVWSEYADGLSLIQGIKDAPMSLVYDAATSGFVTQPAQNPWLQVVFPLGEQADMVTINIIDLELLYIPAVYDEQGMQMQSERYEPIKIVGEVYRNSKKIAAIDVAVDFDIELDQPTNVTIAAYVDPYIITAYYSKTFDEQGKESMNHVYNIYGPATCSMMLTVDIQEGEPDASGNTVSVWTAALTVDDMRIEAVITDGDAMWDEIDLRRETIPTALSAPNTNNYVSIKIYHADATMHNPEGHIANVFAGNDTWLIQFTDNIYSNYNLLTTYIEPILTLYPIQYQSWQEFFQSLSNNGGSMTADILWCTDVLADNYSAEATIDDSSCSYEQSDPEAGTWYDQGPTPDPEVGTGDENGSGDQQISWCTDPAAGNYNPEATIDDGFCTPPAPPVDPTPAPEEGPTPPPAPPVDPVPTGPVVGCPDEWASNYNPLADPNNDDNWNLCTW